MLKILIKARILDLLDQFSGKSKKKKAAGVGKIALLLGGGLLLLALLAGFFGLILSPMYPSMAEAGLKWLFFAIGGIMTLLISFMFTMFYAQGAIYEARDNELLLSMPISPSAILMSRLMSLYFLNFLFSVALMGGCGVIRLIVGKNDPVNALGVVIFVLCLFLLPLISTTISCLMGWLISLATRRMRRKAIFQLVLSVLLLGAFYAFTFNMQTVLETAIKESQNIAATFQTVLFPFYAMGMAITKTDWLMMLAFAGCCVVPFAIALYILSRNFIKIVTTKIGAKRTKYEARTLKESSVAWAVAKKDLARFTNSSSYMLNAGMGMLFSIILGVVALVAGPQVIITIVKVYARGTDLDTFLPGVSAVLLSVLAGMTYISAPSISIEGKNLWIMMSTPIKAGDALLGKLLAHLVPAVPASLISSLLFMLAIRTNAEDSIIVFMMPLMANIFCAECGLITGLYSHRFDYPSDAKAVKSGSSYIIPMLATVALSLGPSILFFTTLGEQGISYETCILAATGLMLILNIGMFIYLRSPAAAAKWNKMGNE